MTIIVRFFKVSLRTLSQLQNGRMKWRDILKQWKLIFLFLCCQGFSFPNASALSMAPFKKEAGTASALMGAFQMGFGSLAAALVGFMSNGTSLPMTGVMAGCAVLGLTILLIGLYNLERVNTEGYSSTKS